MDQEWNSEVVEWHEDGSATLTLSKPANVGAEKVEKLTVSVPSMATVKAVNSTKGKSDLEQEIMSLVAMTGMAETELGALPWPDYRNLQAIYAAIMGATMPTFRPAQGGNPLAGA